MEVVVMVAGVLGAAGTMLCMMPSLDSFFEW